MLTLRMIGGRYNGLDTKVAFIRRCFARSLTEPQVRRFAEEAVGSGTRMAQAQNLFTALRKRVRYVPDPVGVEYTKSPAVLVGEITSRGYATGDCDDQACLSYTLLKTIGIPVKIRVIWLDKTQPQHIYVIAIINDREVPFDTTRASGFDSEVNYSRKEDFR